MKPQNTHAGPILSYLSNKCVISTLCNQKESLPSFPQERPFPYNLGNFPEVSLWQILNAYKKKQDMKTEENIFLKAL